MSDAPLALYGHCSSHLKDSGFVSMKEMMQARFKLATDIFRKKTSALSPSFGTSDILLILYLHPPSKFKFYTMTL